MNYFYLYVSLSVLLVSLLAFNVSRIRIKERIAHGDGDSLALKKAIRAHMNTFEHATPFALVVFVLSQMGLQSVYLATLAIGFVVLRVLHSYSMLASKFMIRRISAALTYLFEIVGCLMILIILF
ncbi:MAPEG family protein [Aliikangiella coralliicola]|uniref:MAPEG family protein n=1 Tax=Aliikangiella coralliicola TaxID=2592383 RepID=A0A545TWE1_9GAMM|nr:MAPEG family protein [Aliikangiella coralliicola]TQV81535.1 hypothetical protein FLL46_25640 [Aliikangiella coralliicola]